MALFIEIPQQVEEFFGIRILGMALQEAFTESKKSLGLFETEVKLAQGILCFCGPATVRKLSPELLKAFHRLLVLPEGILAPGHAVEELFSPGGSGESGPEFTVSVQCFLEARSFIEEIAPLVETPGVRGGNGSRFSQLFFGLASFFRHRVGRILDPDMTPFLYRLLHLPQFLIG
ncbi:MAG: hypothetical protein D6736_05610 [Nitrospinota bacterium]|nr:MAG: hypothetical protein D6736_05610 [Nitrospinota bacterium]